MPLPVLSKPLLLSNHLMMLMFIRIKRKHWHHLRKGVCSFSDLLNWNVLNAMAALILISPFFNRLRKVSLKENIGKYRTPTLRNLLFTAPYLHDGSAESLTAVIQQYEQGGKKSVINKHPFIGGFKLNSQQRSDLVDFLQSLSDSAVLNNPAYNNPWKIK